MVPLESPRPDGFRVGFLPKHWSIFGNAVCEAVPHILQDVSINLSLNSTFIALILKKNNHTFVSKLRPKHI